MDFLKLAKQRYSVRAYQGKDVEKEKLNAILEAGRVAPTAANKQPNHFLVVEEDEHLDKLSRCTVSHGAPAAIIVCGDKEAVWERPFDSHKMIDIDATIATDHMMMCAEALGLSSCWLTYFDPEVLRKEFNIPANLVPVNILILGYSADETPQSPDRHDKTRKPLADMVSYGSF